MESGLDHPIWSALGTRQASFSHGGDLARRFDPAVGRFAATRDNSPESLTALADLVEPGETDVYLLQRGEIVVPANLTATVTAEGIQMVKRRSCERPQNVEPVLELGPSDIPEMLELTALTKPGPFRERTAELGSYFGIRINGRLVAMAGERMKLPGFTEVSGICTHPDFRGREFAATLASEVAARIEARGETAFLHAYANNEAAIRLYEKLGYDYRCKVNVAVLEKG